MKTLWSRRNFLRAAALSSAALLAACTKVVEVEKVVTKRSSRK
jgi:hypothetical protein